jgi:mono/diheme cytochrome c family protein
MNAKSERGSARRAILWTLALIVLVGLAVVGYEVLGPKPTDFAGGKHVALADYHENDPTGVPAELKAASSIERGEYLTRAADCAVCHTAKDGVPYAGGRAFVLPFGTLYSTNITPDKETGIGNYTDAEFLDAVHRGVGRGNVKLYPAMPYPSYTYMSDADALAIKAYLFSLKPLRASPPANSLSFPFNQRWLMSFWSAMFNADKRFEPVVDRGADWNRGAYLVEAMGHCGECHTPRNLFFALNNRQKFAGAVQAGWRAYNITPDHAAGVGTWSDADLALYLSEGHAAGRGTAAGPMGEAIDESLKHLRPHDIAAMVTYLRTVPMMTSKDLPEPKTSPAPPLQASDAVEGDARGKRVYEGACAGCHGWTGISPVIPYASLTGTRSINDPAGTNVAQVIIAGGQRHYAIDPNNMPAFGSSYSDAEIASVANYVTARFGAKAADLTAESVAKLRAAD